MVWFSVVLVSLLVFRIPLETLALETIKGVWRAILIYAVTNEAGAFDPFRKRIEKVTPNRLLQVMAFS